MFYKYHRDRQINQIRSHKSEPKHKVRKRRYLHSCQVTLSHAWNSSS